MWIRFLPFLLVTAHGSTILYSRTGGLSWAEHEERPGQPGTVRCRPAVRNGLKRIQHRAALIDGFLAQAGLALEPEFPYTSDPGLQAFVSGIPACSIEVQQPSRAPLIAHDATAGAGSGKVFSDPGAASCGSVRVPPSAPRSKAHVACPYCGRSEAWRDLARIPKAARSACSRSA